MRLIPRGWVAGACAGLVAAAGCGGQATVSGTVTLDDKPLTTGAVTFQPESGGPVATGPIDGSGRYTLQVGTSSSIPPGTYVATVVATEEPKEPANPKMAPAAPKPITPKKYGDKTTSGLQFPVTSGSNTIDIKLTSK